MKLTTIFLSTGWLFYQENKVVPVLSTFTYSVMYGDLVHADAAIETTLISQWASMSRKLDFVWLWFLWNVSRGSKQEALSSSVIGILLAPCIYETLSVM